MKMSQQEQQIESQAQTIESLTKQIERLERELEKCLEPGKDGETTKPERFSTGFRFSKSHRFNAVAERIICSVFQPVNVFVPTKSKNSGEYNGASKKYLWDTLYKAIHKATNLESFWVKREFRDAVKLIAKIINEVDVRYGKNENGRYGYLDIDVMDLAVDLILFDRGEKLSALECLMQALPLLCEAKHSLDINEMDDLVLSIQTIIFVIKLDGVKTDHLDDDENE